MSANPEAIRAPHATRRRSVVARTALYLGALAVVATGVAHAQQYYGNNYSTIPTIGTLFFLNFVAAVTLAVGLVVPLRRVIPRYAEAVRALFAIGGICLGVLSLIALFVSESSGLFGFVENGYRTAIVLAIIVEAAAVVFLAVYLAADAAGPRQLRDLAAKAVTRTRAVGPRHRGSEERA
ncbi:MAG TPA: hypothetical protein VF752_00945 [Thermoleophilaceae bacterium]